MIEDQMARFTFRQFASNKVSRVERMLDVSVMVWRYDAAWANAMLCTTICARQESQV
jgi:hypothetical protein